LNNIYSKQTFRAMSSATRSKKPELVEPVWALDADQAPCVQCDAPTKWRVVRAGRYNYWSDQHHCKTCWPPSAQPFTDFAMTTRSHYYGTRAATDSLIRNKK
jgi:hypothetical protein